MSLYGDYVYAEWCAELDAVEEDPDSIYEREIELIRAEADVVPLPPAAGVDLSAGREAA